MLHLLLNQVMIKCHRICCKYCRYYLITYREPMYSLCLVKAFSAISLEANLTKASPVKLACLLTGFIIPWGAISNPEDQEQKLFFISRIPLETTPLRGHYFANKLTFCSLILVRQGLISHAFGSCKSTHLQLKIELLIVYTEVLYPRKVCHLFIIFKFALIDCAKLNIHCTFINH